MRGFLPPWAHLWKVFFDGVNIVVEAMAFAFAAMQGVLAETPIPSPKPSPVEKSA